MVNLAGTLSRIQRKRILLAGDFLLDTYTLGKAKRISPEAPVPIINAQAQTHRPGGAGNVALNLLSLGQQVVVLGRVGEDAQGVLLKNMLADEGVLVEGLWAENGYSTPVKNRIIAENQQIVRIDHEEIRSLGESLEKKILRSLPSLLQNIDVIAISDYGKGMLTPNLLAFLVQWGRKNSIPVIVDPKGQLFDIYRGATWVKPNLGEAYAAAMLPREAPLEDVAKELYSITGAHVLMITRGSEGLTLFLDGAARQDYSVAVREVKDVTGAGDTVLAMLACCVGNLIPFAETAHYCNIVGGLSVEHLGCTRISLADLARALLKEDSHHKVFDEEHLFALQKAEEGRSWCLLAIPKDRAFDREIFRMIQKTKRETKADLVVALPQEGADPEWIDLLSSLREVDFVILHSQEIALLQEQLQPTFVRALPAAPVFPGSERARS